MTRGAGRGETWGFFWPVACARSMISSMTTAPATPNVPATRASPAPALGVPDEPKAPPLARAALLTVLVLSLGVLAAAFIAQYWFGLAPCVLCLIQRVPFALTATLAGIGLLVPLGERAPRIVLATCGVVFLVGGAIAFYHVGVEEHWWASIAGCGGTPVTGLDPASLMTAPLAAPKPCDRVDWRFAGLTLAGYNTLLSSAAALACLIAARRLGRTLPRPARQG